MELEAQSSPEVNGLQCTPSSFRVLFECDFCEGMFHSVRALRAHRYKVHGIHSNAEVMVDVEHVDCQMDTIHAGGFMEEVDDEDIEQELSPSVIFAPQDVPVVQESKPTAGVSRNTAKKRSCRPKQAKNPIPIADNRIGETTVSPTKNKKGRSQKVGLAKRRLNFSSERKKLSLNAGSLFSGPNTAESDKIPETNSTVVEEKSSAQSSLLHKSDRRIQSADVHQMQNTTSMVSPVIKFPPAKTPERLTPHTAPILPVAGVPNYGPVYSQLSPTLPELKPVQRKTKTKERLKKNLHTSPNKLRAANRANPPTNAPLLRIPDTHAAHSSRVDHQESSRNSRSSDEKRSPQPSPQCWTPESPRIPKVRLKREHKSGMYQVQLFDIPPPLEELETEKVLVEPQSEARTSKVSNVVRDTESGLVGVEAVKNLQDISKEIPDSKTIQKVEAARPVGISLSSKPRSDDRTEDVPNVCSPVPNSLSCSQESDEGEDVGHPVPPKRSQESSHHVEPELCLVASTGSECEEVTTNAEPSQATKPEITSGNAPSSSEMELSKTAPLPPESLPLETAEEGVSEADVSHFAECSKANKTIVETDNELSNGKAADVDKDLPETCVSVEDRKASIEVHSEKDENHDMIGSTVDGQTESSPERTINELSPPGSSASKVEHPNAEPATEADAVDDVRKLEVPKMRMDDALKLVKDVSVKLVDIKTILSKCSPTNIPNNDPRKTVGGPKVPRTRRGRCRQALQKKQNLTSPETRSTLSPDVSVSEKSSANQALQVDSDVRDATPTDKSTNQDVGLSDQVSMTVDSQVVEDMQTSPMSSQDLFKQPVKPRAVIRKRRKAQLLVRSKRAKKHNLGDKEKGPSPRPPPYEVEYKEEAVKMMDSSGQRSEAVTLPECVEQLTDENDQKTVCEAADKASLSRKCKRALKSISPANLGSSNKPPTHPKLRKKSTKLSDSAPVAQTVDLETISAAAENREIDGSANLEQLPVAPEAITQGSEMEDSAQIAEQLASTDKPEVAEGQLLSQEGQAMQKKGFTCSFCGKVYKVSWHFRIHEAKHTGKNSATHKSTWKLATEHPESSSPTVTNAGPMIDPNPSPKVVPVMKRPLICLNRTNVTKSSRPASKHRLLSHKRGKRGKAPLDVYDFTDDSADDRRIAVKSTAANGKLKKVPKVVINKAGKKVQRTKYKPSPVKLPVAPVKPCLTPVMPPVAAVKFLVTPVEPPVTPVKPPVTPVKTPLTPVKSVPLQESFPSVEPSVSTHENGNHVTVPKKKRVKNSNMRFNHRVHWKRKQKQRNVKENTADSTQVASINSGENNSSESIAEGCLAYSNTPSLPLVASDEIVAPLPRPDNIKTDEKLEIDTPSTEDSSKELQEEFASEKVEEDLTPEKTMPAIATPDTGLSTGSDISSDISSEHRSLLEVDLSEQLEEPKKLHLDPCSSQVLASKPFSDQKNSPEMETASKKIRETSKVLSPASPNIRQAVLTPRRRPSDLENPARSPDDPDDDIGYHSSGSCEQMSHDSSTSLDSASKGLPAKRRSTRLSKAALIDLPVKAATMTDQLPAEKMLGLFKMPHVPKESVADPLKDKVTVTCQLESVNGEVILDPAEVLALNKVLIKKETDTPVLLPEELLSEETASDLEAISGVPRSFLDSFLPLVPPVNVKSVTESSTKPSSPRQTRSKMGPKSFQVKQELVQKGSRFSNFAAKLDVFKMKLQKGTGKSAECITTQEASSQKSSAPQKKATKNAPNKTTVKSGSDSQEIASAIDNTAVSTELTTATPFENAPAKDGTIDDSVSPKDESSRSLWDSVFPDLFTDAPDSPKCQEPPTLVISGTPEGQPSEIPTSAPRLIPEPHMAPSVGPGLDVQQESSNGERSSFSKCSCGKIGCQQCYMQRCKVALERQPLMGAQKETQKEIPKTPNRKRPQCVIPRESPRKKKSGDVASVEETRSPTDTVHEALDSCHVDETQTTSEVQEKVVRQQAPHRKSKPKVSAQGNA